MTGSRFRGLLLGAACRSIVFCCLVAGLFSAAASAAVYSDSYGSVHARLTDLNRSGVGLKLVISQAGRRFVYRNFAGVCGGYPGCHLIPDSYGAPAVSVHRAGGTNEPDVFLHLSDGGNICCRSTLIYHFRVASGSYQRSVHVWGDAADSGPARSLGHPRNVYFISDDGRFRYAFGCGGCTPGPIQIWHDQDGRLVDVTRRFPVVSKRTQADGVASSSSCEQRRTEQTDSWSRTWPTRSSYVAAPHGGSSTARVVQAM